MPGFGIISTVISASSNKSVFGYLGMVKHRPTLTNNYLNLPDMLGNYKTLNTSNIYFFCLEERSKCIRYSVSKAWNKAGYNFKDITISHQQVAYKDIDLLNFRSLLGNLRDYIRRVILRGWLRYSPVFSKLKFIYDVMNLSNVNKVLLRWKENFSLCLLRKDGLLLCSCFAQKDAMASHHVLLPKTKLDPNWVTGFVDAEGCFSIIIEIPKTLKWKVRTSFEINLHEKDQDILYKIKSFFGVGAIYHRPDKKKSVYRVTNVNYIKDVIIPHFTKYPLISKKRVDFLLWSEVIKLILNKDHLQREGFLKILSLYASINKGVSNKVLLYYPNIVPVDKPVINLPDNLNPQWVSGFVAGDGGFSIYVRPALDYVILEKVYCRFHIAQHIKDLELLKLFIKFFDCGVVALRSNLATPRCDFIVQNTASILDKILPHFDRYPLLNLKEEDYICFKECMTIIKLKKHLTIEGLKKIKELNLEMNSNRLK